MLNCPYNKIELITSLVGIDEEREKELEEKIDQHMAEFMKEHEETSKDMVQRHEKAMAFHGLTREEYFNSPNLNNLLQMYSEHVVNQFRAKLVECGLTDKQAWYIVLKGLGENVG